MMEYLIALQILAFPITYLLYKRSIKKFNNSFKENSDEKTETSGLLVIEAKEFEELELRHTEFSQYHEYISEQSQVQIDQLNYTIKLIEHLRKLQYGNPTLKDFTKNI